MVARGLQWSVMETLSETARDVYGLVKDGNDKNAKQSLLKFINETLRLGGVESVVLGGESLGYPDVVFGYGGLACCIWVRVNGVTTTDRHRMDRMASGWVPGVIGSQSDFLRHWERVKRVYRDNVGVMAELKSGLAADVKKHSEVERSKVNRKIAHGGLSTI